MSDITTLTAASPKVKVIMQDPIKTYVSRTMDRPLAWVVKQPRVIGRVLVLVFSPVWFALFSLWMGLNVPFLVLWRTYRLLFVPTDLWTPQDRVWHFELTTLPMLNALWDWIRGK